MWREELLPAQAICYGIEFGYKIATLGWREYYSGVDWRPQDRQSSCVLTQCYFHSWKKGLGLVRTIVMHIAHDSEQSFIQISSVRSFLNSDVCTIFRLGADGIVLISSVCSYQQLTWYWSFWSSWPMRTFHWALLQWSRRALRCGGPCGGPFDLAKHLFHVPFGLNTLNSSQGSLNSKRFVALRKHSEMPVTLT